MKHLTARPVVDELPAPFPNVIRKALAKDPKDRYQTVPEMVADLFEVADIEQSVASFEPASLSVAAAKAAANLNIHQGGGVATLGTGSSNVGQSGAPPVVKLTFGIAGFDRINDRVQGGLDRLATKIDKSSLGRRIVVGGDDHSNIIAGVIVAGRTKRAEIIARTATTAALCSLAIGFVSDPGNGLQAAVGAFAFMAAIVGGVVLGAFLSLEKLKSTNDYTARCIMAALTTFWSSLALTASRIGLGGAIGHWFIAVAIIMLMSDWLSRFLDGRRGIVSGGRALKVGLFAFIIAGFFNCNVPLMGFSVLVASLLVQMIAGAWPYRATEGAGPVPPPPPSMGSGENPDVAVSRDGMTRDPISPPSAVPQSSRTTASAIPSLPRSSGARVAWFMASIPFIVGSISSFIASGLIAKDDVALGKFSMGGVAAGIYGLFALSRSVGVRQRGMWRGVWRPLVFSVGIALAACCGIGAGLISSNEQQMFVWLVGTVCGAALAALVWAIPVPAFVPITTPEEARAQTRRRGKWMVGIGLGLIAYLLASMAILLNTIPHHLQGTVMPAYGVPMVALIGGLIIFGARNLHQTRNGSATKLALPLKRTFEVDSLDVFERTCERHLAVLGYRQKEKRELLWQYTRGTWHAQFWQKDIRQWPLRLSLAAYESGVGRYRITCYLDIERAYADASRAQLEQLDAELADLQQVLMGRDAPSAV